MFLSSGIQVSGRNFSVDTNMNHPKKGKLKKGNAAFSASGLIKPSTSLRRKSTGLDLRRTLSNGNTITKSSAYSISSFSYPSSPLPISDLRNSLSKRPSRDSSRKKTRTVSSKDPIQIAIDNDFVKVVTTLDKTGYRVSSLTTSPSSNPKSFTARSSNPVPPSAQLFTVNQKQKPPPRKSSELSAHPSPTLDSSAPVPPKPTVSKNGDYGSFLSDPNANSLSQKSFHPYPTDHTGRPIFTISVYNLHRAVDLDNLRSAFSQFGALADVVLLVTPSGMSMGQAHVSYYDKAHCQAAIDNFNNKLIDKQYIKIEHVKRPVGLQYTLSNMMIQNQQEAIAKGTSFVGAGVPFPVRTMFPAPQNMFGPLGWTG